MKFLNILLVFIILFLNFDSNSQTLIAGWDFQTITPNGTAAAAAPNTPKTYIANVGTGVLYLDGTNGSSDWYVPSSGSTNTELNAFTGTDVNATNGLSTTTNTVSSLAVLGGLGGTAANGKKIVFAFSMSNYSYFKITYSTQRTSTGFSSQIWEYSADGGLNWTSITSISSGTTSGTIASNWSTSGVITVLPNGNGSGLGSVANALVRVTFNGASNSTGNNRLDNFQIIGSATALPVMLSSFNVHKVVKNNVINWSTASEQNNSGFNIERSTNGIDFENIGFVKSLSPSGNSSNRLDYSFTDYNPIGLNQYYRLKQIDFDGTNKYSAIVLVTREAPSDLTITRVYPNPASNSIFFNASAPKKMDLQLLILDVNGRVVSRKNVFTDVGNNGFDMNIENLASGTYFIKAVSKENGIITVEKFLKN